MAFDFDASDAPPDTLMKALSYQDKYSNALWAKGSFDLNLLADRNSVHYVRNGAPTSGQDIKTLDLGNLFLFSEGSSLLNATVGLLEVSYTVDLYTPQVINQVGGRWTNTTGLTLTQLVGDKLTFTADASSVGPFVWVSSSELGFIEPFEGIIVVIVQGGSLTTPGVIAVSSGVATLLQALSTGTTCVMVAAVSVPTGSYMKATLTGGASVTSVSWLVGNATYQAFTT
jgi:hypothetical protein